MQADMGTIIKPRAKLQPPKRLTMLNLQGQPRIRFKILVDMDGIIADCNGGIISMVKKLYNIDLERTDFVEENAADMPKLEEVKDRVENEVIRATGFFTSLEVLPGAQKYMQLLARNHDVRICSAPTSNYSSYVEKNQWLDQHFPFIPHKNRIFTKGKDACVGDIFIDDRTSYLEVNQSTYRMTIDDPTNQDIEVDFRAYDYLNTEKAWSELYFCIQDMSNGPQLH